MGVCAASGYASLCRSLVPGRIPWNIMLSFTGALDANLHIARMNPKCRETGLSSQRGSNVQARHTGRHSYVGELDISFSKRAA